MSSSIAPIFTGISSYASDLQSVINRAVGIASLPLQQLQSQLQGMNDETSALNGLDSKFSALQTAVAGLASALGPSSFSGTSSAPDAVSVSVSTGAMEGSYTVEVSSIGSYSTSISGASLPAVADPASSSISSSTAYTLTVDGHTYSLSPQGSGLTDLAQAINASSAGVQASLVNTGNSDAPSYRLVLRSARLGPVSIQLNDGSQDLLDTLNTGALASYKVNGLGAAIESDSRAVTLAPGVTVNLKQPTASGETVAVDVSRNLDALSSAVSSLVDAYNAAVDAVDQQTGPSAGALSGQSIVYSLYRSLRQINTYSANSSLITSLAGMGVTLDKHGKLSFDAKQFSTDSVAALQAFMGSPAGGGFLKAATDSLNGVEDSTTGSVKSAIKLVQDEITRQNGLITENQRRINDLQANLAQQMAAADALLASLESQKSYITNLFTAMMNNNDYGGVKSN
jgi:flagellar hook-associated protein 2